MFISLEKHKTIVENLQIKNNKLSELLTYSINENENKNKEINKLKDDFDKKLEEEVKSKIDWYDKFAQKLLNEAEKSEGLIKTQLASFYKEEEYKIARVIIERYLYKDELIKNLQEFKFNYERDFYERKNAFEAFVNNFGTYEISRHHLDGKKNIFISWYEQLEKLKQELATQVANNITLVNQLEKLKGVK